MMPLRLLIACALMLFCELPLWAQTEGDQILKLIQAYYTSTEQHEYEVTIEYFENRKSDRPTSNVRMRVQQSGASSYRKIESGDVVLEQFFGQGIGLEVDHSKQTIRYDQIGEITTPQQPVLQTVVEMAKLPGMQLDILANNGLRLHAPGNADTRIDLIYDPVNYRLLEVSMLIDVDKGQNLGGLNGTKMICIFDYPERSPQKRLSDFLVGNANAYQLATTYQSFTLFR